jgi:superfamily II DNA or RNA helicase
MRNTLLNIIAENRDLNVEQVSKIQNILSKLYDHQVEALKEVYLNKKGIVVLPTGAGKTFLESATIAIDIILNENDFRLYVVNAPRIMLSYQLLVEFYSFLTGFGIDSRYMCVHSGNALDEQQLEEIRKNSGIEYAEIPATTSSVEIKKMISTSKKQKLPLILFSTYNSSDRIEQANECSIDLKREKVHIILNDEAHYLVQNNFHSLIEAVKCEKQFFFTATTKITESINGQGMNNIEKYGDKLYQMTPRVAIDLGFMIRPRIHFVKTGIKITKENFNKNIGQVIFETYRQHQYVLDGINPKMLIAVKGVDNLKNFHSSEEYRMMIAKGIDIYMVSSDKEINNMINGQDYSRLEFLNKLKEAGKNNEKRFIVLHYDIIAEGIDVSGFTGVLVLRTMGKSKFLQTYGRIARLHLTDKDNIKNGKLEINDLNRYLKPYGWIIIPTILAEDEDNKAYLTNLIEELRDYGFKPEEDIKFTETDPASIKDIEGPDALIILKKKSPGVFQAITELQAEYEDEKLASLLNIEDKLSLMSEMFSEE